MLHHLLIASLCTRLVKLVGRSSGFITMQAYMASEASRACHQQMHQAGQANGALVWRHYRAGVNDLTCLLRHLCIAGLTLGTEKLVRHSSAYITMWACMASGASPASCRLKHLAGEAYGAAPDCRLIEYSAAYAYVDMWASLASGAPLLFIGSCQTCN